MNACKHTQIKTPIQYTHFNLCRQRGSPSNEMKRNETKPLFFVAIKQIDKMNE